MSPRRALGLALVAAGLLLANAFCVSRHLGARIERVALQPRWALPVTGVQTLVLARFRAGAPDALALLATSGVRLLAGDGKLLARLDDAGGISASATGDMDDDAVDEIWIVRRSGPPYFAEALGGGLETRLRVPLPGLSLPVRILPVDLDGDGRCEIVAADDKGTFGAYDRKGKRLWTYLPPPVSSPADAEVRGLDDVKRGRERRVAVAHQGGRVALLDAAGRVTWQKDVGRLRRLRCFDVDGDGSDDVLLGTESGLFLAHGPTGSPIASFSLGEAVTEIRPVEVDGDPRRSEAFLGGKRGAYAVLSGGRVLLRGTLRSRVSSARGIDTDGDGRDEIFVGTENGVLHALGPDGREMASAAAGKAESVGAALSPLRERLAVVGAANRVAAVRLSRTFAPGWYSPWVAALLGCLAIAGVTTVLLRLPAVVRAAPAPRMPEPAEARRETLRAAAARIRAWVATGKLRAEDAADRLEQIEKRLADLASPRRAPLPASPPPPSRKGQA